MKLPLGLPLTLETLESHWHKAITPIVPEESRKRVEESREVVERALQEGKPLYGITTGFGKFSQVLISPKDRDQLQINLIRSHACGVGKPIPLNLARWILILRAHSLCKGYSGVRLKVIEELIFFVENNLYPKIPLWGSVGASGDLAPLAHVALALIGEGEIWFDGAFQPAGKVLTHLKRKPLTLKAKEGLALINGTTFSLVLALDSLFLTQRLFHWAVVIGVLTLDVAKGSDVPLDERIHTIRNQAGQMKVAACQRELLKGSQIRESHRDCSRIQDNYSLRCMPQVYGALWDHLSHIANILSREIEGVTDNPLIFPEDGVVLSGGNFHAEPLAIAADLAKILLAELASLSERRLDMLLNPSFSELPPFLVKKEGLESGFMIPQVASASLVSALKTLAFPASIDTIPTSLGKEDHVSMAPHACWQWHQGVERGVYVLAYELLAALRGLHYRRPLKTSPILEALCRSLEKEGIHPPVGDEGWGNLLEKTGEFLKTHDPFALPPLQNLPEGCKL